MANVYAPPPRDAARRGVKPSRDWYSVSVDSVKRGLVFVVAIVGLVGLGLGYQRWERLTLEQRAAEVIEQAGQLAARLTPREESDAARSELTTARETLEAARSELAQARFEEALNLGQQALVALERIDQGGDRNDGPIRFQALRGNVEYRRGERGAWRRARSKDTLHPGDWLKTSADGSAEIVFPNKAVYTLRQNTMVHLGADTAASGAGAEPRAEVVFGLIEVDTSTNGGKVTTPLAETIVQRDSEGAVTFDRDKKSGNFASYSGGMEVVASSGERRRLGALEQVEQTTQQLSAPKPLPGRPTLQRPPDNFESDFAAEKKVVLGWSPVEGSNRYRLRISRDRLFAETLIDVDRRTKTTATLGVRGEGSFFWQVAAFGPDGVQGPWSDVRSFRVVTLQGLARTGDNEPPPLEVSDIQTYGSLVLVNGKTEAGANVKVNGEAAAVSTDGSFNKAIQMSEEGWAFLEIDATDAWGNASHARKRVFVDAF